ncbi:hypothetical protein ABZ783_36815 [Micromonospora sp. NPDC047738]|uniref:hypothetical protein n=1 Tax=Micromonospora sp. NPDC047738 TaxID=3155741 RepID=UPI0033E7A63F
MNPQPFEDLVGPLEVLTNGLVEGTCGQRPSAVLRLAQSAQCGRDRLHPAEQAASFHSLSVQRPASLGEPVSVGFDIRPDQAHGEQPGHCARELGFGQNGVVDAVGLLDDLAQRP